MLLSISLVSKFSPHCHDFIAGTVEIQDGKVKVKFSLCLTKHHAMKLYWGNGGVASRILDLGTRWRQVVSFTSRALYPQGKSLSSTSGSTVLAGIQTKYLRNTSGTKRTS
jgi:hypothetical protein